MIVDESKFWAQRISLCSRYCLSSTKYNSFPFCWAINLKVSSYWAWMCSRRIQVTLARYKRLSILLAISCFLSSTFLAWFKVYGTFYPSFLIFMGHFIIITGKNWEPVSLFSVSSVHNGGNTVPLFCRTFSDFDASLVRGCIAVEILYYHI